MEIGAIGVNCDSDLLKSVTTIKKKIWPEVEIKEKGIQIISLE